MSATVVFTRAARAALLEILDHIALDSPAAALTFIDRVETSLVTTLSTFPQAGPRYQGDLRFHVIRGYAFIYRHEPESRTVFVLDVFGPGENWRPQ